MKTSELKIADGAKARSVLECGSPLPLLEGWKHPVIAQSAGGPAHSKTWRPLAALLCLFILQSAFIIRAAGQQSGHAHQLVGKQKLDYDQRHKLSERHVTVGEFILPLERPVKT